MVSLMPEEEIYEGKYVEVEEIKKVVLHLSSVCTSKELMGRSLLYCTTKDTVEGGRGHIIVC